MVDEGGEKIQMVEEWRKSKYEITTELFSRRGSKCGTVDALTKFHR
jgi:hypothetical protein